jgi:hypothetical protein
MAEERYDKSHHAGGTPEARIAARLRNSGGEHCDHSVQHGSGPTRTYTNIHSNAGQQRSHPSAGHTAPTPKERDTGRFPKEDNR